MGSLDSHVSAVARELQGIFENLQDTRVKNRKSGLERLEVVLGKDVNLAIIDSLTFGVGLENGQDAYACEYASWKSILECLMEGVQDSVAKALRKGQTPDSIYSRVVRTVVNKAISKQSPSSANVLEPCASSLMEHLSFIMGKTYPYRQESQIYNDYAMTLKFLLDNGEYTVFMGPDVFEQTLMPLATMIFDNIEPSKTNNALSSFMVKDLTNLRTILLHLEYDVSQPVMDSLLKILAKFGENKNLKEWTARICNEVVGLCVQVMVYTKGDCRKDLSDIVDHYHYSCLLLLREGNPEGRGAAFQFFRVALKLELLTIVHVRDLWCWYQGSVDLEGVWQQAPESCEYTFNHTQSCLAYLLGEIEIWIHDHSSVILEGSDNEIDGQMFQRMHLNVLTACLQQPTALGPVACIVMERRGRFMQTDGFDNLCTKLDEELREIFQHSFVSEQVKPGVVWILRFLYATTVTASKRPTSNASYTLGNMVSFLIQQYKVLSNYQVTSDLIKMIIIAALPQMHDSIRLPNADAFRQELLSESPSSLSMILFTLLIRYKKIVGYGHTEIMLSCNWILESVGLGAPSQIASAALSTVVFGGEKTNMRDIKNHIVNLETDTSWLAKEKLDHVIDALPPVSKWALHKSLDDSMRLSDTYEIAEPVKSNVDINQYVSEKIMNAFEARESVNMDQFFRLVAIGLGMLYQAKSDHQEFECWSCTSKYFEALIDAVEKCIKHIEFQVSLRANLSKASARAITQFSNAVSLLGSQTFSEYHQALLGALQAFPTMDSAFSSSMNIRDFSRSDVEQQGPDDSQIGYRTTQNLIISRSNSPARRGVPMLQWFLNVYQNLHIFDPSDCLQGLYTCLERFYESNYFLPLAIRHQLAMAEYECICNMLKRGQIPEDLHAIQFLQLEKGIYSYDETIVFRSGILEDLLSHAHRLILQAQNLEKDEDVRIAMQCISDQTFQIISESIERDITIKQRIYIANLVLDLLEIESRLVSGASFESLVEWLAILIMDRYPARIESSKLFPRLLGLFKEPKILFQKVLAMLPLQCNEDAETIIQVDSDLDVFLGTVVLSLGTVASKIPSLELLCISSLIQEFTEDRENINEMILDTLCWLGGTLGYDSARDYVLAMSRSILVHMMRNSKRAVFCMSKYFLICQKLGLDEIPEKEILLSFLIHHRSINGVRWLLRYLNIQDFHRFLLASRGEICAVHLYLTGVDEMEGFIFDVANNISKMASLLNESLELDSIMEDLSEDIIINIIGHGWESGHKVDRRSGIFSKDVLIITELVNKLSTSENHTRLRHIDAVELLIQVQTKIYAFRHPRHKVQALKGTKCSILYVQDYFGIPGVLRQVLAILKILIRLPTTCEAASEMLVYVVGQVLTHEEASKDFESLIRIIQNSIPLVISYICDTYSNSEPPEDSAAVECIRYLTCNAPGALRKCTFIVDPRVESLSGDKNLSEFFSKQISVNSLELWIDEFANIVGLLSESTKLRYIKMIQQMIRQSIYGGNGSNNGDIRPFISENSLWKIVLASASHDCDKPLMDFAGELVAYFGPLGPQVLSFKPTEYNYGFNDKHDMSKKAPCMSRLQSDVYCECLLLLSDYLVEEDALVASEAFMILQEILSTPAGCTALNRLNPSIRAHLDIFVNSKVFEIDEESERKVEKPAAQLWELDGSDYDFWITRIGHDILLKSNDEVLARCANLAKLRANFAEVLLPLAFVQMSEIDTVQDDGTTLGSFLGSLITIHILPYFGKYPKAAKVVLKTLHVMRQIYNDAEEQALTYRDRRDAGQVPLPWNTMYWLEIDYLVLTKACIDCRSLYSALIFAEMWEEEKKTSAETEEFQKYEHLMQEIYSLLPEPDGLYAMSRSNDALSQLRRFEREGDWARAMVISDLAIQLSEANHSVLNIPQQEALNSLRRCLGNLGSSFLLSSVPKYKKGVAYKENAAISDASIALGEWYPIESSNDSLVSETTDPYLAVAMQHFQIGYSEGFIESIHNVRNEVIHLLASASRETTSDLNPLIVKAQMAQNMSEAWNLKCLRAENRNAANSSNINDSIGVNPKDMVGLWKQREDIAGRGWRFSLDMPLKDLRYELLKSLKLDEFRADSLLDIATCARKADRNGQALGALSRFRQSIANLKDQTWARAHRPPEASWRVEEAKTLWAQNQYDAAVMTLMSCSMQATCSAHNVVDVAYLNCVLAKWLASTQRESSSQILKTLKDNTEILAHYEGSYPSYSNKVCRVYYRLASYANQLSKEIAHKKLSIEWLRSKSILEKKIQERQSLKAELQAKMKKRSRNDEVTGSARQMMLSINKLDAAILEDSSAFGSADTSEREYYLIAIKGYALALTHGSHYDLPAMFRLIDIWLSHTSKDDEGINECFEQNTGAIPSSKLIPLSYQLASRLSSKGECTSTLFQENLASLIFRMAKEHPYHMLPILFALKNGNKTSDTTSGPVGGLVYEANESRIEAAFAIIDRVRILDERMESIVYEMELATQGYISLARITVDKTTKSMPFPATCRRQFCRELKNIPVLSILLPLDHSLEYKDIPTIHAIDEKITFPGGINKPKLVTIIDSHGVTRRQLVKGGRDDLRQDAVMQQFFRICNAFLRESKSTASRNLSIQTYFALPFSPTSGVLEWIDNTDSLSKFITDGNLHYQRAAHSAYQKLEELQKQGNESIKFKLKVFEQCIKEVGEPRMRKVFLRRFPDPGAWFEARLSYTRSVAVNSMAGHIIGLGDRHLTNILISKETAEVIHIDLGIAFEQGRLLPTPERVPFRLTRNMVDGMGATGVEGVMKRCCEETIRVLRKHKDPILTVLSVFIHDPLYNWALTYDRATKKQEDSSTMDVGFSDTMGDLEGNVDANRTLLHIQHKLEGIVGGDTTSRGVEGQVQYLIGEAMEYLNLCRMYRGWQAYI